MSSKVNISELAEEMGMQMDGHLQLVNKETGEIVHIMESFIRMAEDEKPYGHLPDWQQEEMELAIDFVEYDMEKYVLTPSQFDINEYGMMEDFCFSIKDPGKQDKLLHTIRGKGAFRRFKDMVIDLDLAEDWYDYRDKRYRQTAIEFCEDYGLEYVE
ncbi:hypothetical protein GCM10007063_18300 [Lentibacillus kapialis]|uniref:Uncharacterized protein n=1 Tax=Lentibacillus kapialis TaxID=340214 RepID=A0A917UYE2_9BACI|nr:UPF0158 family protein [Lentibacillus kapialis]GGJ96160.1 hypothetical protein GCM10007063_18300 [Lentibacillus kapialis]